MNATSKTPLRIAAIADLHYAPAELADTLDGGLVGKLVGELGVELLGRALFDALADGPLDAIVLLGDLVNDGKEPYAADGWAMLREMLERVAAGVPVLVVPGNHDVDAAAVRAAFDASTDVREIGGWRFVTFDDAYREEKYCTRPAAQRAKLAELVTQSGGPIAALQHNPIWPDVVDPNYPFMPEDVDEIRAAYAADGVRLSLSGHYHAGQPATEHDGTLYRTAPALAETPHRYDVVTLAGDAPSVEERSLTIDGEPGIVDTHAHTEFAYCGKDIHAAGVLDRARRFGLAGVWLVEHAPQLYLAKEDFWRARHIFEPDLWRQDEHNRMAAYRELTDGLDVGVGFEVELDVAGQIVLRDEDRRPDDLLVGAIHWLTVHEDGLTDRDATVAFLGDSEKLCAGSHILAHPWRYFGRAKRPVPTNEYATLADMLAATNTAAEINFHTNRPDPRFFAMCIERGVKIALGSDAHWMYETANFAPHVRALKAAVGSDAPTELAKVLYTPLG